MTFNGLDLLFVIFGIILLFGILEIYIWFRRWRRWDYDRRRERKFYLQLVQDSFEERAYREELRRLIRPGVIQAVHSATRAFEKLHEVLTGIENQANTN